MQKKQVPTASGEIISIYTELSSYLTEDMSIEEIINIPELNLRFQEAIKRGYLNEILTEILIQSKVEFNYENNEAPPID